MAMSEDVGSPFVLSDCVHCGRKIGMTRISSRVDICGSCAAQLEYGLVKKCRVCRVEKPKNAIHSRTGACRQCAIGKASNLTTPISMFRILLRDEFRCIYCGRSPVEDDVVLHVDHIQPRSKGGLDRADNLVTSCQLCNLSKHDRVLPSVITNRIKAVVGVRNIEIGLKPEQLIDHLTIPAKDQNEEQSKHPRRMKHRSQGSLLCFDESVPEGDCE